MLEEEINKSFQTLKSRYGNDSFLQKAALRRTHLNYDRIYFGKLNGQKNYLRALLPQAHAAYYIGSFHACIALCGSMLEALLQMKIREELKKYGKIDFYFYTQKKKIESISSLADIEKMTFNDMITLCNLKKYLPPALFMDLCNIKEIRNQTLHYGIPRFMEEKDKFKLTIPKGKQAISIILDKEEVRVLKDDGYQITSYYCLSRMRRIFKRILVLE